MRFIPGSNQQQQLNELLNGGITLIDNFRGGFLEFTTTGALQTLVHNLGFVPTGFIIIRKDGPCDIYAASRATWNNQTLSLNSSASNVDVVLYVL